MYLLYILHVYVTHLFKYVVVSLLYDVIKIGIVSSIVALTGHVNVFARFLSRKKEIFCSMFSK